MKRSRRIALGLVLPLLLLVLWWIATSFGGVPATILPHMSSVGKALVTGLQSRELTNDLSISLLRVLKGYAVAVAIGVTLGSAMGMSGTVRALFTPLLSAVRQVPIIAWIPLIILWFGIGESAKVVTIALAAIFPVLLNTTAGVLETPAGYLEVSRLYRLNRWETFWRISLPSALPHIFVGLRLGLSIAWMAVVAAELVSSLSGIGYRMSLARSLMQADKLILYIFVVGAFGLLMDKILTIVAGRAMKWKQKEGA